MKVITISGHARNGKDTVANFLNNQLKNNGYKTLITHYADLVKYVCEKFFNWNGLKDEHGRTLLQYVGTDVVRNKNPDYWVGFIVSILEMFDGYWDFVIIPDTRFVNEIKVLKEKGFDVIHLRVVRPNFDNGLTKEQKNHPSETSLDNVTPDYTIINDGGSDELKEKVEMFLKENVYGN